MAQHIPRLVALGLLLALALCALARGRAQTTDRPAVNPAGEYQLASVDGKSLPCTIDHGGTPMIIQSGRFTITTTNHQCLSVMTVSVGDRKDIRIETRATYTLDGSDLTMKWQNAGTTRGRVAGQTFTMTNEGRAFVFKK